MRISASASYRCPVSGQTLKLSTLNTANNEVLDGDLHSPSGKTYPIAEGIPNFTYPDNLLPSDSEFLQKYETGATQYEIGLNWLFQSFYEDQNSVRNNMIDLLKLKPNYHVLEIGCGTGKDSLLIAERLCTQGQLFLHELSPGMLRICKKKFAGSKIPVEFLMSNASYLPFPDGYFDAVYHFGGVNTFSEIGRAFAEMTRVTRQGGTVVVGDEGVPPWLRDKFFGKVLINANPLYKHEVPLQHIPECARNVNVRWVIGNAFYVISYDVGEGSPPIDLDLPIPGKGDSLRSRYVNAN